MTAFSLPQNSKIVKGNFYKDKTGSKNLKTVNENASTSVKRIFHLPSEDGLSSILPFIETKTVWHPKGR